MQEEELKSPPPQEKEQSSEPVNSSTPTESKQTNWTKIFFLVFVVILLVIGGFYVWDKYIDRWSTPVDDLKPNKSTQLQKEATPSGLPLDSTPSAHPSLEVSNTKNWELYKNEQYGYQIDYPPSWYVREIPEETLSNVTWYGSLVISNYKELEEKQPEKWAKIEIDIYDNRDELGPEEWVSKQREDAQEPEYVIKEELLTINGQSVLRKQYESPGNVVYTVYISRGDKMYEIWLGGHGVFDAVLNDMLQTFRFTE